MSENILKLIKPADIISLVNALLGFASIIMTVRSQLEGAVVLILIAVIADGADGAVARYSGNGVLGANLDSLADVISFGVAPAAAAFAVVDNSVHFRFLAWASAGFFLTCGILRLARFNVAGKKDGFEGIPITAGGFIVALYLIWLLEVAYTGGSWGAVYIFVWFLIPLLVILSVLMVSTISYPKLKKPVLLAPIGLLLVFDISAVYLGYRNEVKIASLILLVFMLAYILSPLGRRFYVRDK